MREIFNFILLATWIGGVVLAKTVLLKLIAFVFPFYAWYLVAQYIMILFGVV